MLTRDLPFPRRKRKFICVLDYQIKYLDDRETSSKQQIKKKSLKTDAKDTKWCDEGPRLFSDLVFESFFLFREKTTKLFQAPRLIEAEKFSESQAFKKAQSWGRRSE